MDGRKGKGKGKKVRRTGRTAGVTLASSCGDRICTSGITFSPSNNNYPSSRSLFLTRNHLGNKIKILPLDILMFASERAFSNSALIMLTIRLTYEKITNCDAKPKKCKQLKQ